MKLFAAIDAAVPPLVPDNPHIRTTLRPAAMPGSAKLDAGFEVCGVRGNDTPVGARR